jgi:hypothetical protein
MARATVAASRPCSVTSVERLGRFEDHRYVGDKRNQVVHDVDGAASPEHLQDMLTAESYLCFAPDTLAEARNRGYRLCRVCGAHDREASHAG